MAGLLLATLLLVQAPLPPPSEPLPALVYLADGTSVPLYWWQLSYEFVAWPEGSSPEMGTVGRRESAELWMGKTRRTASRATLEIERPESGRPRLFLLAEGRRSELKPDPPARELLQVGRDSVLLARSLDLYGRTLTGTRRDFCLLSYSATVTCGSDPAQRVTRIEFPPASR